MYSSSSSDDTENESLGGEMGEEAAKFHFGVQLKKTHFATLEIVLELVF